MHRKLKIEQHEHHQKLCMNSGAPELSSVHAPHVTPVLLLINDTNIIIAIIKPHLSVPKIPNNIIFIRRILIFMVFVGSIELRLID
jgi:hypothetical protein